MKVGDLVRLKSSRPLRSLLEPWARASGRIAYTHQDDDDDGLRISVAFDELEAGCSSPLSAEEFEPDDMRPGEPF